MVFDSVYLNILAGFLTGCLLFIACIGIGYQLTRALQCIEITSVGLLAFLGLAVTVTIGGILGATGLISVRTNTVVLIIGICAAIPLTREYGLYCSWQRLIPKPDTVLNGLILLVRLLTISLIILQIFGSILPHWGTWNDDWTAYYHFPKLMLETGSFIEPFNLRRMGALGGASYIATYFYPFLSTSALAIADNLIGLPLLWLLTRAILRTEGGDSGAQNLGQECLPLFALMIAVSLHRQNHFPIVLPMAMMLGLILIARTAAEHQNKKTYWVLLGLTAASVIALRNNFIAFVGLFSGFLILSDCRSNGISNVLRIGVVYSLTLLACLTPWLALSYQSSATPFFPLISGNYNFPVVMRRPMTFEQEFKFLVRIFWYSGTWVLIVTLLLGILLGRLKTFVVALVSAAVLALTVSASQMNSMGAFNVSRYAQPYLIPTLLLLFAFMLTLKPENVSRRNLLVLVVALSSIAFLLIPDGRMLGLNAVKRLTINIDSLAENVASLNQTPQALSLQLQQESKDYPSYQTIQERLPKDARLISVTAKPYYWDFSRQSIQTLDMIGLASPAPGLPLDQDAMAVAQYFRKLGYQFLVYTPFEIRESMYSRTKWKNHLNGSDWVLVLYAPYTLRFMHYIEDFEGRGAMIYADTHLRVIDLSLL